MEGSQKNTNARTVWELYKNTKKRKKKKAWQMIKPVLKVETRVTSTAAVDRKVISGRLPWERTRICGKLRGPVGLQGLCLV